MVRAEFVHFVRTAFPYPYGVIFWATTGDGNSSICVSQLGLLDTSEEFRSSCAFAAEIETIIAP